MELLPFGGVKLRILSHESDAFSELNIDVLRNEALRWIEKIKLMPDLSESEINKITLYKPNSEESKKIFYSVVIYVTNPDLCFSLNDNILIDNNFKKIYKEKREDLPIFKEWYFFIRGPYNTLPKDLKKALNITLYETKSFIPSADFRSVKNNGKEYTLTSKQASVVELLYNAYMSGATELSQDYIIEQFRGNRLRDIFRTSPEAWRELICKGTKKGNVRLNINEKYKP